MATMNDDPVRRGRRLLRAGWESLQGFRSDQQRGVEAPQPQKPCHADARRFPLPPVSAAAFPQLGVAEALSRRRSRRRYTEAPLSIDELAFMLDATGGLRQVRGISTLRAAPSAGARHSLETYVASHRVTGLEPGLWRYLPMDHALCHAAEPEGLEARLTEALMGQGWGCPVVVIWTAIPYRMEWRYGPVSPKLILLDAGHACENLYLACECLGCGACAIGAYDQDKLDALLGVDGEEELAVYAATVGKI